MKTERKGKEEEKRERKKPEEKEGEEKRKNNIVMNALALVCHNLQIVKERKYRFLKEIISTNVYSN